MNDEYRSLLETLEFYFKKERVYKNRFSLETLF